MVTQYEGVSPEIMYMLNRLSIAEQTQQAVWGEEQGVITKKKRGGQEFKGVVGGVGRRKEIM